MTRLLFAVHAALVLCLLLSARASAQAPQSSSLTLRAATLTSTAEPRDPALLLDPPDPELWAAQRRARLLLAAGAGMVVGSAVHLSWAVPKRVCVEGKSRNGSLYGAGVFGGLGLSFAIGGGVWLFDATRRQHYPATLGQIVGATALAIGTAVTTQALLGLLFSLESAGACAN